MLATLIGTVNNKHYTNKGIKKRHYPKIKFKSASQNLFDIYIYIHIPMCIPGEVRTPGDPRR